MNKAKILRDLGDAIRRERTESQLSQEGLAAKCGLHRTYIGSIERGERNLSVNTLTLVAKALGLSASSLLQKARI